MKKKKNLMIASAIALMAVGTSCTFNVNVNKDKPIITQLQGDGKQYQSFPASKNDQNHIKRLAVLENFGVVRKDDDADYRYNQ